jgi:subtilisin family serine protease
MNPQGTRLLGCSNDTIRRAFRALIFVGLGAIGISSNSAQIHSSDKSALQEAVKKNGLVRVMVTLDHYSLRQLSQNRENVRQQLAAKTERFYAELGKSAFPTGRWSNDIGQISFYTDAAGLKVLDSSSSILAYRPDSTGKERAHAFNLDGSLDLIEEAFQKRENVSVDLVLNTEDPPYTIQRDGTTKYQGASEVNLLLDRIQLEPFAKGIQNIDRKSNPTSTPIVTITINREAFYGLRDSKLVRAIRLHGAVDTREANWPAEAIEIASKYGSVEMTIMIRGGASYGLPGVMSPKAYKQQIDANKTALLEILSDAGFSPLPELSESDAGLGVAPVRATLSQVGRLYEKKDKRILSIDVNKGVAKPALLNSTSLINMPQAWLAGYLGTGQTIVIIDSGVRKTHELFKTNGLTRVTMEACFGSNDVNSSDGFTYVSICPMRDSIKYDSPLGLVDSGLPYSDVAFCTAEPSLCNHGTAVAGVAAGHASPNIFPQNLQGVAPTVNITSVQAASYRSTFMALKVFDSTFFNQDVLAALQAPLYGTTSGSTSNPYVVNISIGTVATFPGDCNSQHMPMYFRIGAMKSMGVPVIFPTGNKGIRNGISFPACLAGAIKAGSVGNDTTGLMVSKDSNQGPQTAYTGKTLLAPGGNTELTAPNTVKSAYFSSDSALIGSEGTSIAAPHVAGMFAALKSVVPGISVDGAAEWIYDRGVDVPVVTYPGGTAEIFKRIKMPNF